MVKVREIISELERAGWVQIRQTGSHRHCKHAMCVFRSFRTGEFGASSTGRRAPHCPASCGGRATASDVHQEVAERHVFGAALDEPKVAGLPTWRRHGLFGGNAVVVDLNVAEG